MVQSMQVQGNVSPPDDDGGLSASAKVCEALATSLQLPGGGSSVLPSSTGVSLDLV